MQLTGGWQSIQEDAVVFGKTAFQCGGPESSRIIPLRRRVELGEASWYRVQVQIEPVTIRRSHQIGVDQVREAFSGMSAHPVEQTGHLFKEAFEATIGIDHKCKVGQQSSL